MKIPINCPICGDVLLTTFSKVVDRSLTKKCSMRVDHYILLDGDQVTNDVTVFHMRLSTNPNMTVVWNYIFKLIGISTGNKITQMLPWFEPDFSDLPKLLAKIKTYTIFS